jgi:hypothetical protein
VHLLAKFCEQALQSNVPLFMAKLASKNQPEAKRNEASVAVTLYFKMAHAAKADALSKSKSESDHVCSKGIQRAGESPVICGDLVAIPI